MRKKNQVDIVIFLFFCKARENNFVSEKHFFFLVLLDEKKNKKTFYKYPFLV